MDFDKLVQTFRAHFLWEKGIHALPPSPPAPAPPKGSGGKEEESGAAGTAQQIRGRTR